MTVPQIAYFFISSAQSSIRNEQFDKLSYAQLLEKDTPDYALIKDQIDQCTVDYVEEKTHAMDPSLKYFVVHTTSYVNYVEPEPMGGNRSTLSANVLYKNKDQLKTDIDTSRATCPKVIWYEAPLGFDYDAFNDEYTQYMACNIQSYQRLRIGKTNNYIIRVNLIHPVPRVKTHEITTYLLLDFSGISGLQVQESMYADQCNKNTIKRLDDGTFSNSRISSNVKT